jgi:hypothetical protein
MPETAVVQFDLVPNLSPVADYRLQESRQKQVATAPCSPDAGARSGMLHRSQNPSKLPGSGIRP